MLKRLRLRRLHKLFLESCRNLETEQDALQGHNAFGRWFSNTFLPDPLVSLNDRGKVLLQALRWLEENCQSIPLNQEILKKYHSMIEAGPSNERGVYRKSNVYVTRSKYPSPPYHQVPRLMKQLDLKLSEEQKRLDGMNAVPLEMALDVSLSIYLKFVLTHPFLDGNGRVARLLLGHLLRRYGLGYVILPPINKSQPHFEALEEVHKGDTASFATFARTYYYAL